MKQDLVQRNTDLEQFACSISHNLRGPVANMVGISDALLDKGMDATEKDGFMNELSVFARKPDNTIINLTSIIQVKQHINENKEWVEFSDVVCAVTAGHGYILAERGITISCAFSCVSGMSTLKTYLHSIFYNLASSSVKFRNAARKAMIEIKSYLEDNKILITFRDNGMGIDIARCACVWIVQAVSSRICAG